jgi:hypothetical protein
MAMNHPLVWFVTKLVHAAVRWSLKGLEAYGATAMEYHRHIAGDLPVGPPHKASMHTNLNFRF